MSLLDELKDGLAIHTEALHKDAERQPQLACDAAELAAEAKAAARRAKLELEETKATVQRAVRSSPERFGIDKVTEGAIAAAVTVSEEVMQAERTAVDRQEASDKIDAVATAFEHRRAMLKIEAELWLSNYWGDVTVKDRGMRTVIETTTDAVAEKFEQAQGRVRRRRIDE